MVCWVWEGVVIWIVGRVVRWLVLGGRSDHVLATVGTGLVLDGVVTISGKT